jgi:hypothetical protein
VVPTPLQAVFNAEMMNAFQSYGPADWQQTQLGSQLLMADAFDYALGRCSALTPVQPCRCFLHNTTVHLVSSVSLTCCTPPPAGFTAQLLADADGRGSDTELYMGQYTKISYIRLVANVDSSCEHETLHW